MTRCERFLIRGRVQGVGFRYATLHQARQLGVAGWVRNLPDGSVEVVASAAPDAAERLHAWLRHGPPGARVTGIERQAFSDDKPLGTGFDIR